MIPKQDAEDWLRNIQAPRVVESGHRRRLKNELIREIRKEKTIMSIRTFRTKKVTFALGIFLALVLVAGAWAGIVTIKSLVVVKTGDSTEVIKVIETIKESSQSNPAGTAKTVIVNTEDSTEIIEMLEEESQTQPDATIKNTNKH